MTPSPIGAVIGIISIIILVLLYRNADMFSNGNVGSDDDG